MKAAVKEAELPRAVEHLLKFLISLFLSTLVLGFCLALIYVALGVIAAFANLANWLVRIRHDISHHHYFFLRGWSLWTAAEWRLIAWLAIAAVVIKLVILRLPLFDNDG